MHEHRNFEEIFLLVFDDEKERKHGALVMAVGMKQKNNGCTNPVAEVDLFFSWTLTVIIIDALCLVLTLPPFNFLSKISYKTAKNGGRAHYIIESKVQ